MIIESIQTYNFRNLCNNLIDTDHQHIILIGENGQGKSNLLETIYILCYGSSFRTRSNKDIICFDKKEMSLIAKVNNDAERHILKIMIKDGKRKIFLDNSEVKDRKALLSICTCIIFSHEDMNFVKGSPVDQRRFFDQTNYLITTDYIDDLRLLTSIIKQRNAALKHQNQSIIAIYDNKLAEVGFRIQKKRVTTVQRCNEIFPDIYEKVSEDGIKPTIKYYPSWKNVDSIEDILDILKSTIDRDKRYEMTTTGPHRDKYGFIEHGRNFISTASTGQIRLTALCLKSTQALIYEHTTKNKPILLIDDVLLELDVKKRERFLSYLTAYDQAFFTFLPDESYFKQGTYDSISYIVKEGFYTRI